MRSSSLAAATGTRFILASASPRRIQLLAQLGLTPEAIHPAEIDETPYAAEKPAEYAARIARTKAETIAARYPAETLLAADTVVALGRRILPKAENEATARTCLALLSGRRHRVLTAVCVLRPGGDCRERTVTTVVRFAPLTPARIDDYIHSDEWRGKAGGYAIQGAAASFIPFLSGSYTNVVGLPLFETAQLLRAAGVARA